MFVDSADFTGRPNIEHDAETEQPMTVGGRGVDLAGGPLRLEDHEVWNRPGPHPGIPAIHGQKNNRFCLKTPKFADCS